MIEKWKDIPGYEGLYQVSDMGRVKSCAKYLPSKAGSFRFNKELILNPNLSQRYFKVSLCKNNIRRTANIHRIVIEAFIPNPSNKSTVNHIDGNKLNNCLSNLEWATTKENVHHAINAGLFDISRRGEASGSKLTEAQVIQIKKDNRSLPLVAADYGVTKANIWCIRHKKSWVHV